MSLLISIIKISLFIVYYEIKLDWLTYKWKENGLLLENGGDKNIVEKGLYQRCTHSATRFEKRQINIHALDAIKRCWRSVSRWMPSLIRFPGPRLHSWTLALNNRYSINEQMAINLFVTCEFFKLFSKLQNLFKYSWCIVLYLIYLIQQITNLMLYNIIIFII